MHYHDKPYFVFSEVIYHISGLPRPSNEVQSLRNSIPIKPFLGCVDNGASFTTINEQFKTTRYCIILLPEDHITRLFIMIKTLGGQTFYMG